MLVEYITGKKVSLRKANPEDAELLCKWYADGRVMIHVGFPDGLHQDIDELRQRLVLTDKGNSLFIILDEYGHPIGECNFNNLNKKSCDIGIKICEIAYQGKGYGQDALDIFIRHLFTTYGLERIGLNTLLENHRAQNLYIKIGFKIVKTNYDCWIDPTGTSRSSVEMVLTKNDFFND